VPSGVADDGRAEDGSASRSSTGHARQQRRHAFCPLCGAEQSEKLVSEIRDVAEALCPGRCGTAWRALVALRLRESESERLATRRRLEYQAGQPHEAVLSELLLEQWRAGDWEITPERLLPQLGHGADAPGGHSER
jgi:hypothetical protein